MAKKKEKRKGPSKEQIRSLAECEDRHGDIIPEKLVQNARNPRHPYHHRFPWDDKTAAHLKRLEIAREIIVEVRLQLVYEDVKLVAPAYVSNPARGDSAYIAVTKVAKDDEMKEMVMLDELRRIESAVIRARNLAKAFDMVEYFDRLLNDTLEIRGKIQRRRAAEQESRASV